MPRYRALLRCTKCKNVTFFVNKVTIDYEHKEQAILYETMAHDGMGWDTNTFDMRCALCGGGPEVYVTELEEEDHE